MAITPLSKKMDVLYADFPKDLLQNPVNLDISRKTDEEAVKESIRNILLTNRGERLFNPSFGCDLRALLFENMYSDIKYELENSIRNAIEVYEPRCNLIQIDAISALDTNSVIVNIVFTIINIQEPITLSIALSRVR